MSSAADAIMSAATDSIYMLFGEAATYTPKGGTAVACTVLVEHDLTQYGETARVQGKSAVIGVRTSQVPIQPRRGDVFAVTGGKSYAVDSMLSSDPIEHKAVAA